MHKRYLLSVFLLSLCMGCGTGEYESRIGKAHGGGGAAASDPLGTAEELPNTRVSVRVPLCAVAVPDGADPRRSKAMPVPGVQQRTYEGFVKDNTEGSIPFYCHVIAVETAKVPGQNLAAQLSAALAKAPQGAPAQPTDMQVANSAGKESKWQLTRLVVPAQEFYYKDKAGQESYRPMDAVYEMYTHEEAGFSIMIVWRVPSNIEQSVGKIGLASLAKATAGGVSVRAQ
jgi:hypothetical protein